MKLRVIGLILLALPLLGSGFDASAQVATTIDITESRPLTLMFSGNVTDPDPYMTITGVVRLDGTLITDPDVDSEVGRRARIIPGDTLAGLVDGTVSPEKGGQKFIHGMLKIKAGWSWFSSTVIGDGWRVPAGVSHREIYPNGISTEWNQPEKAQISPSIIDDPSPAERIIWGATVENFAGEVILPPGLEAVDVLDELVEPLEPGEFLIAHEEEAKPSPFMEELRGALESGLGAVIVFATDARGNTQGVMTVNDVMMARHDGLMGAPTCALAAYSCDSGKLLNGVGHAGPEPNGPNTLDSCSDGTAGNYHSDESVDRIIVSAVDGGSLAEGTTVQVDALVWAWAIPSMDTLDLYYTADVNNPEWILIDSLKPTTPGAQMLTATYDLPAGEMQAVRANFRFRGFQSPCTGGAYNDVDDLVFAVNPGN